MANHPGDTESRVAVLVDCGHKVSVGRLGSCLERADPSFSPKSYGLRLVGHAQDLRLAHGATGNGRALDDEIGGKI